VNLKIQARNRDGRFRLGQSGNPLGRPKGARNRSTISAEVLLEGEAQALTWKAIQLAMAGDTTALRLCLERLLPPRKDRPLAIELPVIANASDAVSAMSAVLAAVGEGTITPSEAVTLASLIEAYRRVVGAEPAPPPACPIVNVSFVSPGEGG
jgi:hypothetical protein